MDFWLILIYKGQVLGQLLNRSNLPINIARGFVITASQQFIALDNMIYIAGISRSLIHTLNATVSVLFISMQF